jgi:hypothetical protein
MAGRGNLQAELAKIRSQQVAMAQVKIDAAKDREERLKKVQSGAGAGMHSHIL